MSRIRGGFLVAAAALLAGSAVAQDACPAVSVDGETGRTVSYPGGEPGRRAQDYSFIAVVLSADAVCTTDDDDRVIAEVNVTYAIEAGPLYRGSAELTVQATVLSGDGQVTSGTATKKSSPSSSGGSLTVTNTISGLVVGDEDLVEEGAYTISVGFAQ